MAIYDFMVVQQRDGYGEFSFLFETVEWIKKPVTEAEKHFSSIFCGMEFRLEHEETGAVAALAHEIVMTAERDFEVKLTAPTGGPYTLYSRMIFCDKGESSCFPWLPYRVHIGVGDVFLIAGQSNAAGTGRGAIYEQVQFGVSAYRKDGRWDIATHPLSGSSDRHSPFLTFAKAVFRECGYPIGLIPRAVGGTYITQWVKGGNLTEPLKAEIARENIRARAILWYQGENEGDRNMSDGYFDKLTSVFSELREALGEPELPIFMFQLNRTTLRYPESDEGYSVIREIQRTAPRKIRNTYVIPTIDARTMCDWIHNSRANNLLLGERLANYALDYLYGKRHTPKAPDIAAAYRSAPDTVTLEFDNVEGEIYSFLRPSCELPLVIRDCGGELKKLSHRLDGSKLSVTLDREIGKGATVSGMYGANPDAILADLETQLPVLPFHNVKIKP